MCLVGASPRWLRADPQNVLVTAQQRSTDLRARASGFAQKVGRRAEEREFGAPKQLFGEIRIADQSCAGGHVPLDSHLVEEVGFRQKGSSPQFRGRHTGAPLRPVAKPLDEAGETFGLSRNCWIEVFACLRSGAFER
jgi:hypothetical protein